MKTRLLILNCGLVGLVSALLTAPTPAIAQGNESATVQTVAAAHVDLLTQLRAQCDVCDRIRPQLGEDAPDVQACERAANALKGQMTRYIAYALFQRDPRWGLRRKDGGANAIRPTDGVPLSTDVVMWRDSGQVVDVMSDRDAGWSLTAGDIQPRDQWVQPLPEGTAPADPPGDDPQIAQLKQQLATATARIAALEQQLAGDAAEIAALEQQRDGLQGQVADLRTQLQVLQAKPAPTCESSVPAFVKALGVRIGCRVIP